MADRLSANQCRKLLGSYGSELNDTQVVALRDHLYELAGLVTDAHADIKRQTDSFDVSDLQSPQESARALRILRSLGVEADSEPEEYKLDSGDYEILQ